MSCHWLQLLTSAASTKPSRVRDPSVTKTRSRSTKGHQRMPSTCGDPRLLVEITSYLSGKSRPRQTPACLDHVTLSRRAPRIAPRDAKLAAGSQVLKEMPSSTLTESDNKIDTYMYMHLNMNTHKDIDKHEHEPGAEPTPTPVPAHEHEQECVP